jgi:hypothetical protein
MKIKIAVEARIDARDRRRCKLGGQMRCQWLAVGRQCDLFDIDLDTDSRGRPLRCRECIAREVKP